MLIKLGIETLTVFSTIHWKHAGQKMRCLFTRRNPIPHPRETAVRDKKGETLESQALVTRSFLGQHWSEDSQEH